MTREQLLIELNRLAPSGYVRVFGRVWKAELASWGYSPEFVLSLANIRVYLSPEQLRAELASEGATG